MEGRSTGQVLHGSAATQEAIRRTIQFGEESPRARPGDTGSTGRARRQAEAAGVGQRLAERPKQPKTTVLSVEESAICSPPSIAGARSRDQGIHRPTLSLRHDEQFRARLADFVDAFDFGRRSKALKGLSRDEFTRECRTSEPERFSLNPSQKMPEQNTRGACNASDRVARRSLSRLEAGPYFDSRTAEIILPILVKASVRSDVVAAS